MLLPQSLCFSRCSTLSSSLLVVFVVFDMLLLLSSSSSLAVGLVEAVVSLLLPSSSSLVVAFGVFVVLLLLSSSSSLSVGFVVTGCCCFCRHCRRSRRCLSICRPPTQTVHIPTSVFVVTPPDLLI